MPEGELQAASEVAPPGNSLVLSDKGRDRLDDEVQKFRKRVQDYSRECAENAGLDSISATHVDQAVKLVCQMGPQDRSLRVNPHIWWLLAGVCFAIALAIPDAGSMFFGTPEPESDGWLWWSLKAGFIVLVTLGMFSAIVALLIALGPYQPKWFRSIKIALSTLVDRH